MKEYVSSSAVVYLSYAPLPHLSMICPSFGKSDLLFLCPVVIIMALIYSLSLFSICLQSLFTSSPFSDPLNVKMLPSSNTGTGAYSYSGNSGPNISLVNPKIDANNLLTIIVFFVLGTFLLTLVLLAALYAKRLVEKNFFSIPPFCSMYTLVVVFFLMTIISYDFTLNCVIFSSISRLALSFMS